ncbi:MAG: hypothetical protein LDLANPLL_00022 [Turneriella sp.]|nr:hypothetical protein [Turneriella sp.]
MLSPHETTLTLAARYKIDFSAAWAYLFRDAALFSQSPKYSLVLLVFYGGHVGLVCALLAALVASPFVKRIRRFSLYLALPASVVIWLLFFTVANPLGFIHRAEAMGKTALGDILLPKLSQDKIPLDENCVYIVNPSDVRGVSSIELIDKKSALAQPRLYLLDLKVVEENYRFLSAKDQVGLPLFSDAARAFADAETVYAAKIRAQLLHEPKLCLVANFSVLPDGETKPYSRARGFIDARKELHFETIVVQLP